MEEVPFDACLPLLCRPTTKAKSAPKPVPSYMRTTSKRTMPASRRASVDASVCCRKLPKSDERSACQSFFLLHLGLDVRSYISPRDSLDYLQGSRTRNVHERLRRTIGRHLPRLLHELASRGQAYRYLPERERPLSSPSSLPLPPS